MLTVSAVGLSQNVTFSGKNAPLESAFSAVEKQTSFVFLYGGPVVKLSKPITISASNMLLEEFLQEIFKSQPLKYSIKGKSILVSPRLNAFFDENKHPVEPAVQVPPIRGIIRNATGQVIAGATIIVNGTKNGVTSDNDGHFNINANAGDVLTISSIGFNTMQIRIKSDQAEPLMITLVAADSKLDEVQIIAYGSTTRRLNTGSVVQVSAEEIQKQPVNNILQALIGRTTGMNIYGGPNG